MKPILKIALIVVTILISSMVSASVWTEPQIIAILRNDLQTDYQKRFQGSIDSESVQLGTSYHVLRAGLMQITTDYFFGQIAALASEGKLWDNAVDFYNVNFTGRIDKTLCFRAQAQIGVFRYEGNTFLVQYFDGTTGLISNPASMVSARTPLFKIKDNFPCK